MLLQVYAFLQYLKDRLTRQEFQTLFFLGVSVAAGVVFLSVIYLTYTGWLIIIHFIDNTLLEKKKKKLLKNRKTLTIIIHCTLFKKEYVYKTVKMAKHSIFNSVGES